ncbi:hypothetical protein [Actinoplanes sp. NPDC048796]|uniref:hypothetical protein n=1 Tax=Actinoplanes sp. NPDC048796 TaxID=3155640 RepID=UPI0034041F90
MSPDRLTPRTRNLIAVVAAAVALTTIAVRAFLLGDENPWNLALWAVQGLAMVVAWAMWGTFRRRPAGRNTRRLLW